MNLDREQTEHLVKRFVEAFENIGGAMRGMEQALKNIDEGYLVIKKDEEA